MPVSPKFYVAAAIVGLICLVFLQRGCVAISERRQEMRDQRWQHQQDRKDDRQDRKEDRRFPPVIDPNQRQSDNDHRRRWLRDAAIDQLNEKLNALGSQLSELSAIVAVHSTEIAGAIAHQLKQDVVLQERSTEAPPFIAAQNTIIMHSMVGCEACETWWNRDRHSYAAKEWHVEKQIDDVEPGKTYPWFEVHTGGRILIFDQPRVMTAADFRELIL